MRGAFEADPSYIRHRGYFFKQLVNCNVFIAQLGFCCVYFVFMADNLEDFFRENVGIVFPKSVWMVFICISVLGFCSIRKLSKLGPFATAANVIYLGAVAIVETPILVTTIRNRGPEVTGFRADHVVLEDVNLVQPLELAKFFIRKTTCCIGRSLISRWIQFGQRLKDGPRWNAPC
uniref:Aa_trans domain-containing protein n=2 Tax=Bursaphelenchus xylophilus TaxID=6326 RepID=A0A1I7RIK8_BURXY